MSVLIKDMEMPTSCTMCWLNTFCGVWNTEPVKHKGFNERLEGCPLTELILCKDCRKFNSEFCAMYNEEKNIYRNESNDFCSWAECRGEHGKTD